MITVDAMGKQCPLPVVMTMDAIKNSSGQENIKVLVDNDIAVQNLQKMAKQKGYESTVEKKNDKEYIVSIIVDAAISDDEAVCCQPDIIDRGTVVVVSADTMGTGDEKLGKNLMKAFIFALSKSEKLPETMLFYNRGAFITTDESLYIEDLKNIEAQGTEILTCGTCLDLYGLKEKLQIGDVTNMYTIVEKQMNATKIIKP